MNIIFKTKRGEAYMLYIEKRNIIINKIIQRISVNCMRANNKTNKPEKKEREKKIPSAESIIYDYFRY